MVTRRQFLRTALCGAAVAVAGGLPEVAAPPLATAAAAGPGNVDRGQPRFVAFTGGTVIDATGVPPRPDTIVLVGAGRILAVGWAGQVLVPPGALVIDARDKFIVPGLWDMHVHTTPDRAAIEEIAVPLYLANGVTGIREMWGFRAHHEARQRIHQGEIIGPRWVIASALVDGPGSVWPGATEVHNPAEARQAVRTADQAGADFVKAYSFLAPDTYAAIVDEAARREIPVAGHLPYRVRAATASEAGQRSFEHLISLFIATARPALRYQERLEALTLDPARPRDYVAAAGSLERAAVADHDPCRAAALFDRFVGNGTWQCPTFSVLRLFSSAPEALAGDPRLRYVPAATRSHWEQSLATRLPPTPERRAAAQRLFDAQLELVGAMAGAGVPLLAGTDCGNPYTFSGFSLHDELEFLVEAGLSPLQALQAATRDAARFAGLGPAGGTITPGAPADLVVLDANPLADIANTRRIDTVVVAGTVIDRTRRAAMLAAVEARIGAEESERHPASTAAPSSLGGCPCHAGGLLAAVGWRPSPRP